MSDAKRLLELKDRHAEAVRAKERLEGKKDALLARLKKDFGLSSLKEAKDLKVKMEEQVEEAQEKLTGLLEELEALYGY